MTASEAARSAASKWLAIFHTAGDVQNDPIREEADLDLEAALIANQFMPDSETIDTINPCSVHYASNPAEYSVVVTFESGIVLRIPAR